LDNLLNPWWLFVAKFVPSWASPNLVTSTGLCVSLSGIGCIILVRAGDPGRYADGHVVFLVTALCSFAYQTLDAVDGKHARNTGQSTPLGALFDHGCDCVACLAGVLALELCSSTPGTEAEEARTAAGFVAFLFPAIAFFAAQWEHLYTHQMPAGGVTEAQFCGIFTLASAFMWGANLFQADVSTVLPGPFAAILRALVGGPKGVLVKRVMHFLTTIFATVLTAGSISRCFKRCSSKCLPSLVIPVAILTGSSFLMYMGTTSVFMEHRILCQSAAGLVLMDLDIRMVIAAVCHFEFPILPITMLPFGLASAAGIIFPALGLPKEIADRLHLSLAVAAFCWQLFSVSRLVTNGINKVCARLDIPFLAPIKQKKST